MSGHGTATSLLASWPLLLHHTAWQ